MKGTCTRCDKETIIQNKKHGLCGECVYKKNHGGKSRQEVQMEKAVNKKGLQYMEIKKQTPLNYAPKNLNWINTSKDIFIDEEAQKNIQNQDKAEQKAIEEEGLNRFLSTNGEKGFIIIDDDPSPNQSKKKINKYYEATIKKRVGIKRSKPKQVSKKQAEINHFYKLACIDMDYTTEPVCTGCLRYQGGDIKLSHSHIISREDCKRIGREDLIYSRDNLTYHCLDWNERFGCHRKWENPKQRTSLDDYQKNIEYIKSISKELYLKYSK